MPSQQPARHSTTLSTTFMLALTCSPCWKSRRVPDASWNKAFARLYAHAERELDGLLAGAREAKPLRSLLHHRKGLSVFVDDTPPARGGGACRGSRSAGVSLLPVGVRCCSARGCGADRRDNALVLLDCKGSTKHS